MSRRKATRRVPRVVLPPVRVSPSHVRDAPDLWRLRYGSTTARALYLHIPFCRQKCRYCDFTSFRTREADPLMRRYVMALQHQVDHLGGIGLLDGVSSVYVGGGTPSYLGPWLGWLCETASRWCDAREFTCEANPDSLTDEMVDVMAGNGVTRVSLGVQSLVDAELAALGRVHDAEGARRAVGRARAVGLDVSADLMCGIPLQTEDSWRETLAGIVELGVGHVSVYPLQLEEGTPLERMVEDGLIDVADDDTSAALMEVAASVLGSAGLERYEVASYARVAKGDRSRGRSVGGCAHNRAYWTGMPYLGLGTSAASMLTCEGYERLRWAAPQLPDVPDGTFRVRLVCRSGRGELVYHDSRFTGAMAEVRYDLEFLSERQAIAEDLMLGARLSEGVSAALLAIARDVIGRDAVDSTLCSACSAGLATMSEDGSLVPTRAGWLRGNELYGLLWGLAGDEPVMSASC